jgi:hypothetical protein
MNSEENSIRRIEFYAYYKFKKHFVNILFTIRYIVVQTEKGHDIRLGL